MVERTPLSLAVLGTLAGSLLFHLISFGAPNWYRGPNGNAGLWLACFRFPSTCTSNMNLRADWEKASAAMMTLALVCILGAVACAALYNFMERFAIQLYMMVTAGAAFGAAVFSLIAVSVWGAKIGEARSAGLTTLYLAWAFGLGVVHCVLSAIGGGLAFLTANRS